MSDAPLLQVEDIAFSYGHVQVLFGVSLDVRPGEALALLGTNGAGKSTLLRVITGLERPSAGTVALQGEDVAGATPEEMVRRGVVMVPGGKAVFPDMTVAENLEMQAFTVRKDRTHVRERLDRVFDTFPRLRERVDQRAGTMSGGEQQQLALAKAVVLDPVVLCIDELSLGLAPVVVEELLDVVGRLRESGISLVVVEQSLNVAAALCERAVFLEKGSVRFEGPTAELLERDDIARAVFLGGATTPTAPPQREPDPQRTRRARDRQEST